MLHVGHMSLSVSHQRVFIISDNICPDLWMGDDRRGMLLLLKIWPCLERRTRGRKEKETNETHGFCCSKRRKRRMARGNEEHQVPTLGLSFSTCSLLCVIPCWSHLSLSLSFSLSRSLSLIPTQHIVVPSSPIPLHSCQSVLYLCQPGMSVLVDTCERHEGR